MTCNRSRGICRQDPYFAPTLPVIKIGTSAKLGDVLMLLKKFSKKVNGFSLL